MDDLRFTIVRKITNNDTVQTIKKKVWRIVDIASMIVNDLHAKNAVVVQFASMIVYDPNVKNAVVVQFASMIVDDLSV